MSPREIAFKGLLSFPRSEVEKTLKVLMDRSSLKPVDVALVKELTYGAIKRWLSLEFFYQKLNLSKATLQEKKLFFLALYQKYFMDRVPEHALVFETVELAKKTFGKRKAGWFNAVLRKIVKENYVLPGAKDTKSLSTYYSYPPFFIERLKSFLPKEKMESVLQEQNTNYLPCIRWKKDKIPIFLQKYPEAASVLYEGALVAAIITEKKWVLPLVETEYIQNVTPVYLIDQLAKDSVKPETILDVCASPGGKLLASALLFPEAKLFANDICKKRLKTLKENLHKAGMQAAISENILAKKEAEPKDLVILDVPCSNSGVLAKKAEARWRLSLENLKKLQQKQKSLLKEAVKWVSLKGELWYMTCSILPEENQEVVASLLKEGWKMQKEKKVLPGKGWDGGYAVSLKRENR